MVVFRFDGEGDRGGLVDLRETSREGSWSSGWEGVCVLEETWVRVGDTATRGARS
jgi:hypothetical protein